MSDQTQNVYEYEYAPFPPPERISLRYFVDDPVSIHDCWYPDAPSFPATVRGRASCGVCSDPWHR
jgi:hypothetical protein